jgi:hypothetical protein
MTRYYHSSIHFLRSFSDHFIKYFLFALLTGLVYLISSCEGDPSHIGGKLLPSSDFVNIVSTDTINVRAYTMYSDSIESDNPQYSYLGSFYDPYFGTTTGEFVSQLRLGTSWTYDYFIIDSIKLHLRLLNVTGDINQTIRLKMTEIAKQIYVDSVYYSSQIVQVTDSTWTVDLPDSLQADTINSITINVPVRFGKNITRDTSMLFHSNVKPDFRSYFKGIYFQLISSEPVFMTLSVAPSTGGYSNYFYFYMHNEVGSPITFTFPLDAVTRNAAFNRYIHDFDAAEAGKKLEHINDINYLDTLTYVQKMNGVYSKVLIPGLADIKNNPSMKGISVNKARLIFPMVIDGSTYLRSTIPSNLYLRYQTSGGIKYLVPDYSLIGSTFFDGTPDTTADVYNLNIPAFVQNYLEDKTNKLKPELELFLPAVSSNNVILKANSSHTPVRFEFTWTKF